MALIQTLLTDLLQTFIANQNSNNNYLKSYPDSINSQLRSYAIFPVGHIEACLKSTAPAQTLLLQGQLVSRTTYANLWAWANASGNILSEAAWATSKGSFSVGDGSTTFRLPDLRGCVLLGAGLAASGTTFVLGASAGEEKHTLITLEIASHAHTQSVDTSWNPAGVGNAGRYAQNNTGANSGQSGLSTGGTGGGGAHNNLQPYAVVNYIIVY